MTDARDPTPEPRRLRLVEFAHAAPELGRIASTATAGPLAGYSVHLEWEGCGWTATAPPARVGEWLTLDQVGRDDLELATAHGKLTVRRPAASRSAPGVVSGQAISFTLARPVEAPADRYRTCVRVSQSFSTRWTVPDALKDPDTGLWARVALALQIEASRSTSSTSRISTSS